MPSLFRPLRSTSPFAAALVLTCMAATAPDARADTPANVEAPVASHGIDRDCGPNDLTCARYIERNLKGGQVVPIEVTTGTTLGGGAIQFHAGLAQLDSIAGGGEALIVDAAYLQEGGFRLKITLADTQVLFLCHSQDGKTLWPHKSPEPIGDCKPEPGSAYATIGASGEFVQVQWDEISNRFAARWADIHAVANLLRNAGTEDYLRRRFQAYTGVSADTVFYGNTLRATHGGASFLPRYSFGLTGMYRPVNDHWGNQWPGRISPEHHRLERLFGL